MRSTSILKWSLITGVAAILAVTLWGWLWCCLHNPGGSSFSGTAAKQLLAWGRLAGLLTALAFLFQLISMGRGRLLERAFAKPALVKIHRRLGIATLALLAAHVVLLFIAKSEIHDETFWQGIRGFLSDRSYGTLAAAGLAAYLVVIAFSLLFIQKKIPFPIWKKSHYWAYAAIGLLFLHQIFYGLDFALSPAFRWFWIAVFVLAALDAAVWKIRLWRQS